MNSIPKVLLGNSNLLVSQIGYGCMGLSFGYNNTNGISEEEGITLIGKCLEQGLNFFDTAYMYGDNEFLLAKAIKKYGRDKFIIATKVPPYSFENGVRARVYGGPENIKKYCYESLKRLEIEQIDLYYQHRIEQTIPIEIQAEAFKELIQEGKVKYYGLSEASADTIKRAHKVHPVSAVQEEYSLFTRDIEQNGVLDACKELGITLVAYSPLGRGILTGNIQSLDQIEKSDTRTYLPRYQGDNFTNNLQKVEQLNGIAQKMNITPSQLSLAWLINKGKNIIPIPGTKREKYLTLNNQASHVKLSEEQIKQLDELFPLGFASGERYPEGILQQSCADTPNLEQYQAQK